MKTLVKTTKRTETNLEHEVSYFLFTFISASALLLGIWGAVCLISGLVSDGFVSMARGYISAITGL
jgi:hypothetical protein